MSNLIIILNFLKQFKFHWNIRNKMRLTKYELCYQTIDVEIRIQFEPFQTKNNAFDVSFLDPARRRRSDPRMFHAFSGRKDQCRNGKWRKILAHYPFVTLGRK